VSGILLYIVDRKLSGALENYYMRGKVPLRKGELVFPLIWGLAWLGFSASWIYFLGALFGGTSVLQPLTRTLWVITLASTCILTSLVYVCRKHPFLLKGTIYAAEISFISAIAMVLIYLIIQRPSPGMMQYWISQLTWVLGYFYLTPLALLLTGIALKLGVFQGESEALALGVVYIILGAIFIIPVIPLLPSYTYNPIGAFFPLWGWGAPTLATVYALLRLRRRLIENPEDPL